MTYNEVLVVLLKYFQVLFTPLLEITVQLFGQNLSSLYSWFMLVFYCEHLLTEQLQYNKYDEIGVLVWIGEKNILIYDCFELHYIHRHD